MADRYWLKKNFLKYAICFSKRCLLEELKKLLSKLEVAYLKKNKSLKQ